ncbi:hypothetical protein J6590_066873, partial [Homalodisca vitripennis]
MELHPLLICLLSLSARKPPTQPPTPPTTLWSCHGCPFTDMFLHSRTNYPVELAMELHPLLICFLTLDTNYPVELAMELHPLLICLLSLSARTTLWSLPVELHL